MPSQEPVTSGQIKSESSRETETSSPKLQRNVSLQPPRRGANGYTEVPFGPVPAPSWLPRLAEIVASSKVSGPAVLEPVANAEFLKLKEQLMQSAETNYYARWAKWFCSDRSTRTLSPLSSISVPEYIQRRIEENTLESLQEAVSLAPTNGLAFARLAR